MRSKSTDNVKEENKLIQKVKDKVNEFKTRKMIYSHARCVMLQVLL